MTRMMPWALLLLATSCQPPALPPAPPPPAPAAATPVESPSPSAVEADVRSVARAFAEALAAGDSLRVLDLLHPDAVIFEAGHAETKEEYRAGHLGSDIAFLQAISSETLSERVVPGSDMSLYLREYRQSGRRGDREIDSRGVETLVLVATPDGWMIRHIHWSNR